MFAIFIIVIGFALVSISSIAYGDDSESSKFSTKSIVGIVALFLSLIFQGFCYCYQENLLDTYEVNVMQMIGFESMMGGIMSTIIFLVAMNFKCTHPEFCNEAAGFPIDSPPSAIYDLQFNYAGLLFTLTCISIMIFNLSGLTITKNGGAVFKVILDTLRTIIVWIISVIIGFETLKPAGKVSLELIGFIMLIMGNLVYNELVVIKFFGLDKYIKKNREKNDIRDNSYQTLETSEDNGNSVNNENDLKEQKDDKN